MTTDRIKNIIDDTFIFLFIILVPLSYTTITPDNQVAIRFLLLSIILLFYSAFLLIKLPRRFKIKLNRASILIFLLFIIYAVISGFGLIFTNNITDGIISFSKILLFLSFIILLFINLDNPILFIFKISRFFVVLGSIIILIGIYQFINLYFSGIISHENLYQITAGFGHKNIFSQILLLSLPFLVYIIKEDNIFWKIIGILNTVFIIILLTVLMTRSVWVAAAIGFTLTNLIGFFAFRFNLKHLKKVSFFLIPTVLIISATVLLYSRFDHSSAYKKQITKTFNFNSGSTKDRIILWEKSLKLSKEKPLIGHGLGSWKINILKYGNQNLKSEDNLTFYQRPHNDYVWIFCEQGIIALSAYILFYLLIIYSAIQLLKYRLTNENKFFVLLMIFALISYLSFSFFSFPMDRIEFIIFLSFIITPLILFNNNYRKRESGQLKINAKPVIILISFILLTITVIGIVRLNSETHLHKAYKARAKNDLKTLITEIDKANNMIYKIDPFSTPIDWYKGIANFSLGNYREACLDFSIAYKINPYHIHVLNNLATCKGIEGDYFTALKLYKKTLDIAPNFEDAIFNICAVYQKLNETDSAIEYIKKLKNPHNKERYTKIILILLKQKLNVLYQTNKEEKIKIYIHSIIQNNNKLIDLFDESVKNKITIEQQILNNTL